MIFEDLGYILENKIFVLNLRYFKIVEYIIKL